MAILLRLFNRPKNASESTLEDVTMNSHTKDKILVAYKSALPPPASMCTEPPFALSPMPTRAVLTALFTCICLLSLFFLPAKDVLRQVVELQKEYPATYVITYVVAGLVVPAPVLSALAGVLLGPSIQAVTVIVFGSLGAACLAFALSRFLLRQFVVRNFVMRSKQLQAIDVALRTDSVKLVLCTRMILPFTFNNYFLGTTSVTAATFALATLVTGLPFAITYAIIGGELKSLESALSAKSFELKSADINIFGYFTVSKRHLEVAGICALFCLFFFVIRTVKQFAERVIRDVEQERPSFVERADEMLGHCTTQRACGNRSPRPVEATSSDKFYHE